MGKKLCVLCHKEPARVPDREKRLAGVLPRKIEICRKCHAQRLLDDLAEIRRLYDERERGVK